MKAYPGTRLGIGVIGCGNISMTYLRNAALFAGVELRACADISSDISALRAKEYGIRAMEVDALLADPEVCLVLNLTIPAVHFDVTMSALSAGKHVFTEKPLATSAAEGRKLVAEARRRGLLLGSAPDTFLGAAGRRARGLMDAGAIGRPVSGTAFMFGRGMEHWHPNPQFYYQPGGGPMFDMGPYYLTALVNFLGPIRRVGGLATRTFPERTITSEPLNGQKIAVEVPTHYLGTLEFAAGPTASIAVSFDVHPYPVPRLVIYGTEGTLEAPDPNRFDGEVKLYDRATKTYHVAPATHQAERLRGTGVADMAYSILRRSRPVRASGELAQHVLEAMAGFDIAAASGRVVDLQTTCARPAAVPASLAANELDA